MVKAGPGSLVENLPDAVVNGWVCGQAVSRADAQDGVDHIGPRVPIHFSYR